MKTKKVTIYDIAALAKVSVATVSRVLNERGNVRTETRDKIHQVIQQLNYVPDMFAQSLKKRKSFTVGLIVHDIRSPFFNELIASIIDFFTNEDYHVIIGAVSGSEKNGAELLKFLINKRVEGILLLGRQTDSLLYAELHHVSKRLPVILVGDHLDIDTVHLVNCENRKGGFIATRHLIEMGHRHIGIVTGYENQYDSEERLAGYREALKEAGLPFLPQYVFKGDYDPFFCQRFVFEWWKKHRSITALFCCSDMMAIGCMNGLMSYGLKIPQDFSIVGFDDIMLSTMVYPRLTTISQHVSQLGRSASALLHSILSGNQKVYQRIFNQTELIIRDSTQSIA